MRARLIVLLIALALAGAPRAVAQDEPQRVRIQCTPDGLCLVPRGVLEQLIEAGDRAEQYARLCGW